jgi:hypothetical protein
LSEDSPDKIALKFGRDILNTEEIAMLFGYDIGLGVRKYIFKIFDKISEKKTELERNLIWQKITSAAIKFLRNGDLGGNFKILNKMPSDFEEAKKVYGYKK